jgi:hypothetical protein
MRTFLEKQTRRRRESPSKVRRSIAAPALLGRHKAYLTGIAGPATGCRRDEEAPSSATKPPGKGNALPENEIPVAASGNSGDSCQIFSGPKYTPSGEIAARPQGDLLVGKFKLSAHFFNEEGMPARCCEVRQYIMWPTEEDRPGIPPFNDKSFETGKYYEDRDRLDLRYGHRSGEHSECGVDTDRYLDENYTKDCANGMVYEGEDKPFVGMDSSIVTWNFKIRVRDRCAKTFVGSEDRVTVKFVRLPSLP